MKKPGGLGMVGKIAGRLILGAALILIAFAFVKIFINYDGSAKIATADLKTAARNAAPPDWEIVSERKVSKLLFSGYSYERIANGNNSYILESIRRRLLLDGFRPKEERKSLVRYRGVFCRGSAAIDVEISSSDLGRRPPNFE